MLRSISDQRRFPSQPEREGVLQLTPEGTLFDAQPEAFGSYRVLGEIGSGRFGPVYRAREQTSGAEAVIKVFDQGLTAEQAQRLADALSRLVDAPLDHASILPIVAAGADGDRAWLAELWVDATPLDSAMASAGAIEASDVIVRITHLGGALDFAGAAGIRHGALHPRDVLVTSDRTLIAGLGVIQALGDAGLEVPMEGAYVSPQRARGEAVSAGDDIFSLAAITYELLHGAPVPSPANFRAITMPVSGVDHTRLLDVLGDALSANENDRPATALQLVGKLHSAMKPAPIDDFAPEVPVQRAEPEPPPVPVTPELPLRPVESKHEPKSEPDLSRNTFLVAESESKFKAELESSSRNRNDESEFEFSSRNKESESGIGFWFGVAASLAIGILMGFSGGYVVGQRDGIPSARSSEAPVAEAQPSGEAPAATAGRDFTESVVPQATETQTPKPGAESKRPARTERERPEPPERSEPTEPLRTGALQVDSRPRGARVFVDGRLVGVTPLILGEVQPGSHVVRLDLGGHQRWVTAVDVALGERKRVTASLER